MNYSKVCERLNYASFGFSLTKRIWCLVRSANTSTSGNQTFTDNRASQEFPLSYFGRPTREGRHICILLHWVLILGLHLSHSSHSYVQTRLGDNILLCFQFISGQCLYSIQRLQWRSMLGLRLLGVTFQCKNYVERLHLYYICTQYWLPIFILYFPASHSYTVSRFDSYIRTIFLCYQGLIKCHTRHS